MWQSYRTGRGLGIRGDSRRAWKLKAVTMARQAVLIRRMAENWFVYILVAGEGNSNI
jgi:hypothetical protein